MVIGSKPDDSALGNKFVENGNRVMNSKKGDLTRAGPRLTFQRSMIDSEKQHDLFWGMTS